MQIIETSPTDAQAAPLLEALSEILYKKVGCSGQASFRDWQESDPNHVFVILFNQNEAVGCGAIRPIAPQVAELKRMYAKHSGKGIGEAILCYLEAKAQALGYTQIWLETRKINTQACRFYERNNYAVIENYGQYIGNNNAVCFGKRIGDIVSEKEL